MFVIDAMLHTPRRSSIGVDSGENVFSTDVAGDDSDVLLVEVSDVTEDIGTKPMARRGHQHGAP